ncbi:MAG: hypothetical protein ACP5FH_01650 [Terracidiphilus sp.]
MKFATAFLLAVVLSLPAMAASAVQPTLIHGWISNSMCGMQQTATGKDNMRRCMQQTGTGKDSMEKCMQQTGTGKDSMEKCMQQTATGKDRMKKRISTNASPVFVDEAKKTVWKIDNPAAVKGLYGDHVTVLATADAATKSLHIDRVIAAR